MLNRTLHSILGLALGMMPLAATAQVEVTGSVQSNMMVAPLNDASIGTETYDNKYFLTNTYADVNLQSKYVDAGGRLEFTQFPMPGYNDAQNKFKGWGMPNLWVKGKLKNIDITLGTFYEQFGSGFILRTYEERTLGIDNSLLGGHLAWKPFRGATVKVLSGIQRNYWRWDKNLVSGADMEVAIDELLPLLQQKDLHLTLGASWVNKYNANDNQKVITIRNNHYKLNAPDFVNALDFRARVQSHGFSALAEFATKSQDPNTLNSYIYSTGHAEMLSLTYAGKGLSFLAQAKRSENMAFRSNYLESPLSKGTYINHMPAFTLDQTYALAALYPYATQADGEWAYQGSAAYKLKGRYAPKFKVNCSLVMGLEHSRLNANNTDVYATNGYESSFWKTGKAYYRDIDLVYEHKLNKNFEHHFMYMNQLYNKTIIEGEGGNINSHIFVYEPKVKLNKKLTLRAEAQYLYTAHESGNWGFGLLELSVAPYLMFTVSDQIGKCEPRAGEYGDVTHYYNFAVTGNYKSHRLQVGFGRTRAGYNCTGGVCRYIPASKGVTINYNYNF